MIKVGEHITLDFLGTKQEYKSKVFRENNLQNCQSCKSGNT